MSESDSTRRRTLPLMLIAGAGALAALAIWKRNRKPAQVVMPKAVHKPVYKADTARASDGSTSYKQKKHNVPVPRDYKKMDISNQDRFKLSVAEYLGNTAELRDSKCPTCWLLKDGRAGCICPALKPLDFSVDVRFMIFIHYKEWFNAGDDSKLLLNAAPALTSLFVYGREGDDERMKQQIADPDSSTVVLFPSDIAITVDEYFKRLDASSAAAHASKASKSSIESSESIDSTDSSAPKRKRVNIMVLDGTWNQVRSMKKYLERDIDPQRLIPHVQLRPESLEYWKGRGSSSVYKRTQSQDDRVCTIEAIALLLREMGENKKVCDGLIDYVAVNNAAISPTTR